MASTSFAGKDIFGAVSGGAAAAGAYGGANYVLRDFMLSGTSSVVMFKQLGLATALSLGAYYAGKANWVRPSFVYGAVGFASVMALLNVTVRTAVAFSALPQSNVRGYFTR